MGARIVRRRGGTLMKMRVGALLFVALAVVASPIYAQVAGGGVKLGVNFATINTDSDDDDDDDVDEEEFGNKSGFVIGAFADIGLNDQLSFQPEFLYSQKGASADFTDDTTTVNADLKVDVIQIPLLLKVNFAPAGAVRPFIVVGPGIGFITAAKIESGAVEEDIKDDVASVDFSGIIGAGLQFGRGIVEVRYDHGFNNLDDDEDEGGTAKSRTFTILFGVGFGR
jgi:hypothetical protein